MDQNAGCFDTYVKFWMAIMFLAFGYNYFANPNYCVVTPTRAGIVVREGPGANRVRLGTISDPVYVTGRAKTSDGAEWWQVIYRGKEAWVAKTDVTNEGGCATIPEVTPPPIAVRSTPRAISTPIKSRPSGGGAAPTRP